MPARHTIQTARLCQRALAPVIAGLLALVIDHVGAQTNGVTLGWTGSREGALPAGWAPLTFRKIPRHTRYSVVQDNGTPVLRAQSDRSASGVTYRLVADAKRTPLLRWRWRIENTLRNADVTRKSGDDYPARIYVTFAYDPSRVGPGERVKDELVRLIYGQYPPRGALSYIWDTRAPVGTSVPNPFTDRVRMIVVESGEANVGKWRRYERDLYQDYLHAFGEEPPPISGIAVMTDTDDTQESATAYYAEISLLPAR